MRFFKWLFSWKTIRRALIGFGVFVTLLALVWTIENVRGQRAWKNYKQEMAAKGEHLDLKALIPPPVPDEQNFFAAPVFQQIRFEAEQDPETMPPLQAVGIEKGIAGGTAPKAGPELIDLAAWSEFYRGNTNYPQPNRALSPAETVLLALSRFDSDLAAMREAAKQRPHTRFPVRYEDTISALLPHYGFLKSTSRVLCLRATAYLEAGRSEEAFEDVKLGLRLGNSIDSEPILIGQLVRLAISTVTLQGVKEGCARHAWSDQQLVALSEMLAREDLLDSYGRTIRGERAFSLEILDQQFGARKPIVELPGGPGGVSDLGRLVRLTPGGWLRQNQLTIASWHDEMTLPAIDATAHRAYPDVCRAAEQKIKATRATPYKLLAKILFPAVVNSAARTGQGQALMDQAIVACALERYYLAERKYPETLADLIPRFAAKLPHDVITGEPLKFQRTDDGFYKLYSVGWDGKDDGGKILRPKEERKTTPHDWVWDYQRQ